MTLTGWIQKTVDSGQPGGTGSRQHKLVKARFSSVPLPVVEFVVPSCGMPSFQRYHGHFVHYRH